MALISDGIDRQDAAMLIQAYMDNAYPHLLVGHARTIRNILTHSVDIEVELANRETGDRLVCGLSVTQSDMVYSWGGVAQAIKRAFENGGVALKLGEFDKPTEVLPKFFYNKDKQYTGRDPSLRNRIRNARRGS